MINLLYVENDCEKNPAPLHYKNSGEIRDTKDTHDKKESKLQQI